MAEAKNTHESTSGELRSKITQNAKRSAHALSERLEQLAESTSGSKAKIASRAAELVARAGSALVVDDDAMERLGHPGDNPATRQSAPVKQSGDKLRVSQRGNGAGRPREASQEAIDRAENEGMVP
ncbi:MAG: hypothetical protein KC766_40365 [Myxococcales bacterium]|nr:hypothetical protein [Myxococcales bacterium]